jgi:hypothetical protein
MKTAVIFSDEIKQVIFTPENDNEKFALSLITPKDDIELLITEGSFASEYQKPFTASISQCRGGYLRIYNDTESKILVLKPKKDADS